MSEGSVQISYDRSLQELKEARDSNSVLKYNFLTLRQQLPFVRIFVFEGNEDKQVYRSWISRVAQDIEYEPFVCKGKRKVLGLRESLKRDRAGMSRGVYYFVDRDFDELQGLEKDRVTFVSDTYSVENHLVAPETVEKVLKDEFHCGGSPARCAEVLEVYRRVLHAFLELSVEANRRIFVARCLGVDIVGGLPKECVKIASVELEQVVAADKAVTEWIIYTTEPSAEAVAEARKTFETLDRLARFRGKFLLDFLFRWFRKLLDEYNRAESQLFGDMLRTSKVRLEQVSVGLLAMMSPLPNGLSEFLRSTVPVVAEGRGVGGAA